MWSFSVWNHYKNNSFFNIWVMFWNVGRTYFLIYSIKKLKAIFRFFSHFFFHLSFQAVIFTYKRLFADLFLISSQLNAPVAVFWKHLLSFWLMGFMVPFLPNQENLIITHHIYFMAFIIQQMNTINGKITTFHWCFQPNFISRQT